MNINFSQAGALRGSMHVHIVWSSLMHFTLKIVEKCVGLTATENFCHWTIDLGITRKILEKVKE